MCYTGACFMEDSMGNCTNLDCFKTPYACELYQAIAFVNYELDKLELEKNFGERYWLLKKELEELNGELNFLEDNFTRVKKNYFDNMGEDWKTL